jgi:hypothetical protein
MLAGNLHAALDADMGPDDVYWGAFIPFLCETLNDGRPFWVKDLWTQERDLQSGEECHRVVRTLLKNKLEDLTAASAWASEYHIEQAAAGLAARSEAIELAATRALNGTLSTTVPLAGKLRRRLREATADYRLAWKDMFRSTDAAMTTEPQEGD